MNSSSEGAATLIRRVYYRHLRRCGGALALTCVVPLIFILTVTSPSVEMIRTLVLVWVGTALVTLLAYAIRHYRALERDIVPLTELAALGKSTAQVAHDLMGPLSNVRVALRGLGEEDIVSPQARTRLMLLRMSASRLERIAQDVLGASRMAAGSGSIIDVHQLIDVLIQEYQLHPKMNCVTFFTEYTDTALRIMGEPHRVERVFSNIIKNALEAMNLRGRISVRTIVQDDMLGIAIQDTGPGMPPELIAAIQRGEGKSVGKPGGHGLGLQSVRETIRSHQGRLEISSPAGAGTCFQVWLPLAPEAATQTNVVPLATTR